MQKVINGKRYDTDTAEPVGSADNGCGYMDLDYVGATLYLKRTGEFFLHGEGGAGTQYARPDGTGWVGGERITPISRAEAMAWAEENMSADEYDALFPAEADDDASVATTVRLPAELKARLDDFAADIGASKAEVVAAALERYLGGR